MFSGGISKLHPAVTQPAITCSKLTIETLEKGGNMFKVNNSDTRTTPMALFLCLYNVNFENISHLVLVFVLLTLNMQLPAG